MEPNLVRVDRSGNVPVFKFADTFNVAVHMVDRHLGEGRGDRSAYITDSEKVTYRQLAERVNRCGNALRQAGIPPGERMLMVVKDCPEFVYLFYGAIKAGIIPVPINTLLRAKDYQYIIEDSACAALIYSPEFSKEIDPALSATSFRPPFVAQTEDTDGIKNRIAAAADKLDAHPSDPMADCFWLYSSGSTGRPKGTVHRQRDLIVNSVLYTEPVLQISENDIMFSAAKLFFAYGLGNSMNFPLNYGACTILSDERPTPEMTFRIIEKFKPTIYFGVPTLYAAQCRALETESPDLSSLRIAVSAGEALPAPIFHRWETMVGQPPIDGIGSTEGTHIFISNRPGDAKPGTSGRVLPGYKARIVDDDGNDVPKGEVGRLWVQGKSMAAYYWNQPERTKQTMLGEDWLNTGDTFTQDEDGYFVYNGRSDDMIKVGGIWCSPIEIETRLIDHPKVLEAAVVGREDDDGLVKPEAHIILKEHGEASTSLSDELLEHCKEGLARYKYPRWFHFVEELPKTATGKIQRFKLRIGQ
ncbi:MAG: benzoate-CoA ligase family protein [Pseudomonadota bacterium]|nr:benzoate-CoA ligase family protein [Pseudomonadota bacterium]